MADKTTLVLMGLQTATGAAIAAEMMDGAQTLLPFFGASLITGIALTIGNKKWGADLSYLLLAVIFGTFAGLSASRSESWAGLAELVAISATPFGPLFLTGIRENPAAAVKMVADMIRSIVQAFKGEGGDPPTPPDDTN
mgnify:FL=1